MAEYAMSAALCHRTLLSWIEVVAVLAACCSCQWTRGSSAGCLRLGCRHVALLMWRTLLFLFLSSTRRSAVNERHGLLRGRADTPSACAAPCPCTCTVPVAVDVACEGATNSGECSGAGHDFCSCSALDTAALSSPVVPVALGAGLIAVAAAATAAAAVVCAFGCSSGSCPRTNGCSAASAIVMRLEGCGCSNASVALLLHQKSAPERTTTDSQP